LGSGDVFHFVMRGATAFFTERGQPERAAKWRAQFLQPPPAAAREMVFGRGGSVARDACGGRFFSPPGGSWLQKGRLVRSLAKKMIRLGGKFHMGKHESFPPWCFPTFSPLPAAFLRRASPPVRRLPV